ncbi:MAG: hypothetical protein KUA29_00745, partial [Methanobacterium sp.]|nr:hypothetical protein [Methanobacterium sp.]
MNYGLTVGMPDLEEIWAQDEELENKTENNSAKEYLKRDYRRYYSPKSEDKKVDYSQKYGNNIKNKNQNL